MSLIAFVCWLADSCTQYEVRGREMGMGDWDGLMVAYGVLFGYHVISYHIIFNLLCCLVLSFLFLLSQAGRQVGGQAPRDHTK